MDLEEAITGRPAVKRTAQNTDPTIQKALALINQPINPVQAVTPAQIVEIYGQRGFPKNEQQVKKQVIGFRAPVNAAVSDDPNLYINNASEQYRKASGNSPLAQLLLAASLVHEQQHETEKGEMGEYASRRKEADFIESKMNTLPGWEKPKAREFINQLNTLFKPPVRK